MHKLSKFDVFILIFSFLYMISMVDAHANEPESNDLRYMTEAIYFESRGEPELCQMYVAKTIKTRMNNKHWGTTVKDVVHQVSKKGTCQFSYYCDGKPETMDESSKAYKIAYTIASSALFNEDLPDSLFRADHFINHKLSNKDWNTDMEKIVDCGDHSFYRSDIK